MPAEPRYTATPPALTVSIPASDPGRATSTPRFYPARRQLCPGGTPVNAGGVPAECLFSYIP
ncbi:hypothetical protein DPMN_041236 [Dreissena polymorpha]|uniref:Uncharacterized protein n=1 Tax=Dreissena polymorpha TaxID=45954 RepID=A0A9D4CY99_DREPO|nr:hypothetical protein DPMN_041236 [Dreissena polymorpha]